MRTAWLGVFPVPCSSSAWAELLVTQGGGSKVWGLRVLCVYVRLHAIERMSDGLPNPVPSDTGITGAIISLC